MTIKHSGGPPSRRDRRIVVLYSEVAPYMLAALDYFARRYDLEVDVVCWPSSAAAPFKERTPHSLAVFERLKFAPTEILAFATSPRPRGLFVSGWMDSEYMKASRACLKMGVPVVMLSDTAWRATPRQIVNVGLSRAWIPRTFSRAWVAGRAQARYARFLGFPQSAIRLGMYTADTNHFQSMGIQRLLGRDNSWPHRFLCVARYVHSKGLQLLCDAFVELCNNGEDKGWSLDIVGTGEMFQSVTESRSGRHERIRHLGFRQPDTMRETVRSAGVFVLPSLSEPWGVVVHEQACAGMPMLLSDAVGAGERFLRDGVNGFRYSSSHRNALLHGLRKMVLLSDRELRTMGAESFALGNAWTIETWADTAAELIELSGS